MKIIYSIYALAFIGLSTAYAQVGIGTETPDASATLDLTSSSQGFLPPRMTEAQRNNINTPATGLMVYCTNCGTDGELQVYNGSAWTNLVGDAATAVPPPPTVIGAGGKIWMDRNLGASQVATDSDDAASYGDLYQWGRAADGHQLRTSPTTNTLSTTDTPGHGNFILASSPSFWDWRSTQNDNLWQGVNGVNNPCPSGYRLPAYAEWEAERLSWSPNNSESAFASPLKLPVAGYRNSSNGSLFGVGADGFYWSSTVDFSNSRNLYFDSNNANMGINFRADGFSVRCLKD